MAKKISQLTQATEVKSDDVTVIVQDGETKKLPLNMMVTKQDIENKKVAGLAKLDEIEATYENDTYTPTITVKNKSSVKTGEGDEVDYSANVMDGHVKSAILKGQTLVNLIDYGTVNNSNNYTIIKNNDVITVESQVSKPWLRAYYNLNITYDKKYIMMWDSLEYTQTSSNGINDLIGIWGHGDDGRQYDVKAIKQGQANNYLIFSIPNTSPINLSKTTVRIHATTDVAEKGAITTIKGLKVIEYQEGMENWDIPYFEGMQSVKMPVLTTIGKNLFDFDSFKRDENRIGTGGAYSSFEIKLKPNTQYSFNRFTNDGYGSTCYFAINTVQGSYLGNLSWLVHSDNQNINCQQGRFTTDNTGIVYISGIFNDNNLNKTFELIQNLIIVESNTIPTTYEPFKSNILSTSEDVELRGIGDVQDELDVMTGEKVERIGEIVLDGSDDESWNKNSSADATVLYSVVLNNLNRKISVDNVFCDRFITKNTYNQNTDKESIFGSTSIQSIYIRINKNKLASESVDGIKTWLSQNPITIQYQLATESIKTVDLIPSGTHPSTTPYCWKDGHIQLSSSGLLPSLEYSVVTSRAGQISQNAAMIVKNDKRIFDLEILLAGGLVNTTYQALTLQNQVETGLSKVSLSSETEPDYLLYHMIMKLIDEKAYKLDDLAEKVSVFYLYEKLSDEQFETIYAALYPFVEDEYDELPEDDEIIEEPIVDEVLEEVENEVVM